jgi:PKD domain/Glucodextranase, domain B/IPT/TIG domain
MRANLYGDSMRPFRRAATPILLQLFFPLFAVAAAPVISSLTPNTGAVGSAIVIAGSNFGTTSTTTVTFNGVKGTISSISSTSITATVPSGASTGNVVVTVSGVASNGVVFTVTPPPGISSLTPNTGAIGSSIVIAGSNFGPAQGNGKVTFNGTKATITSWSAAQIVATVPTGATTGNVVVTAAGGVASAGVTFTVTAAPSISSLVPTSGIVGASVTINGSNFGPTQGNGKVTFNGTTATINTWSATQITTKVPAGATTGSVIVTAGGGVSSKGVTFTVIPPPSITSISPTSGATGTSVTINGSNFGSTQGTSTVTFNGVPGTVTSWSSTKVVAPVPAAASTGNVVITVSTQASNGIKFTVVPHITTVSPTTQPIGKNVTINGTGFGTTQGTSTVTFGGVAGAAVSWSTTQISATVPAGAAIGSDPIVVNVAGSGASNSVAFTAVAALTVTATPSPKANANGWNNTNVTISYTCSGGVLPVQCPASQTVSTEGANQTINATATDANGNTATASTILSIDKTAPAITAAATPAPNAKGVVTAPATINFTCSDSLSGVVACPSPIQLTTVGLNESFSGTATDKAGNSANASITVSLQSAPLAITASSTPLPNAAGWNNTAVTVSYSCSGGVPPLQCPASQTVTAEAANQLVSASVTDAAGQSASASTTLNIDKTAPTITATVAPVPNAQGVVTAPATITFTCSDALSGITSCPSPIQVSTVGLNQSFSGTATDKAGNSATTSVNFSVETTPLTISATAAPQPNAAGWNNSPVTISYACGGGVPPLQCPISQTVTTDGTNPVSATVTDAAGQTASTSTTVKVDQTPPAATPVITPSPNAAGWNNTGVVVSFTCSDSVSGVASCPSPIQVSTEGAGQAVCGSVVDAAGNTAQSCATVNIDETPPSISASVSPVPNANGIIFGSSATVTFTCSDALSGIATCPSPITSTTQGLQTISGSAVDKAGNSTSASIQFNLQNFPPLQMVASVSPVPNAAGWNNTPVTVSFQCTGGAPPVSCPTVQSISNDGAGQVITGTATDAAGATVSASATINLDQVPPVIGASVSPAPNTSGIIFGSSAAVTFTCSDGLSGITTCPPPVTVTTPGSQSISGTAIDIAGNTASASVQFNLQNFPPLQIVASVSPAPNAAGWNNTPVTVSFQCLGGLSPVSCPASQTIKTDGINQVIGGTAIDALGTQASTSVTINLDQTPPLVTITSPTDGSITPSSNVPVAGLVSDGLAGLGTVTCNGSPASVSGGSFSCSLQITQGSLGITAQATDVAGNSASTTSIIVNLAGPKLTITSPAPMDLFSSSTISVSGTVDDPNATITVNGIQATNSGGIFTADGVILREGNNLVTATGTNAGGAASTASVNVVLDTTPPTVRIDSPSNQATLTSPQITVTGLVNDVVTGTVNSAQVSVTINGVKADVQNRSFMAQGVLLVPGQNVVTAVAKDRAGNVSQSSVTVTLQDTTNQQKILIVSGNNQTSPVATALAQPLTVEVVNAIGQIVPNVPVTFSVSKSDGELIAFPQQGRSVTVQTDGNGQAGVSFQLGTRVGNGNNQVTVTSPGFVGEVMFSASATVGAPAQIHDISGVTQTGVTGQLLPEPLVAGVFDVGGNPVSGVPVTFKVEQGGGTLEGSPSVIKTTDSDGHAAAVLSLAQEEGINNNVISVSFDGNPTSPAIFVASGKTPGNPAATTVTGIVLDNANQPIPNATASIQGTNLSALTDENGKFSVTGPPIGSIVLFVDGATSTRPENFPFLEFPMVTVAGQDNHLSGPIYLPPLDNDNSKIVGGDEDVTLTMKGVPGVLYTVFAHSATFPDGSKVGRLTLSQVHGDKVPMIPPNGSAPRLVGTLQPSRVKFDPPIRVQLPNTEGFAPGQVVELFSFHHDLEQFVSEGTMRVSQDGSVMTTDAGFGLTVSGWHGGGGPPPPPTCANGCNTGDTCRSGTCVNGACQFTNQPDGTGCDDQDSCTIHDKCQGGACKGDQIQITKVDVTADGKSDKDATAINTTVNFTANVTQQNCNQIKYQWDFGDGGSSTDQNPTHSYTAIGSYTAKVTVTCDDCNQSQTGQVTVNVVKADVDINSTSDTSDDITVLNPALPIQVKVTLHGGSAQVKLKISPDGRATLDRDTLSLDDGTSDTVTLTPVAASSSADDVTITATVGDNDTKVGEQKMTIADVQIPAIRNVDTPGGVPDRIPPRVDTSIHITVAPDLGSSGKQIHLILKNNNATNGDLTIAGGTTKDITATTDVALRGTVQTTPGNAGNIKVVAQVRSQDAVTSGGFSVAAIPQNFSEALAGTVHFGIRVSVSWQSDSTNPADLDQVQFSEQVQVDSETGSLVGLGGGLNSGYLPMPLSGTICCDTHGTPPANVTGPGTQQLSQTHTFKDARTGVTDIPIKNSGYHINRTITQDPTTGVLSITTAKTGASTSANGFASGAGAGGASVTQH